MLSKRYSHETLRKDLSHIRSMLRYAMRISVVTAKVNPADDVVITGNDDSYYKNVDDKILPLSEFNVIKEYLIRFAIKKNDWHTRNMLGLGIAISTGLRGGEILALRYKDIDFSECILTVNHSWDGELVSPKTKASHRVVPIPDWLVDKIKYWADLNNLSLDSDMQVMTRKDGSVGSVVSLTSAFKKLQKKLGFSPQYSLHNLRHTIASHLLNKGVNIVTVSRLLGHSSVRITESYYLGLVSEDKVAERRKVLELL